MTEKGGNVNLPKPGVRALIEHMRLHMNDHNLRADFHDCVLMEAASESERETLLAYYNLRRRSPGWSPARPGPNNHNQIDPEKLAALLRLGNGRRVKVGEQKACARCERTFTPARSSALYCSESCKQRAKRRRHDAALVA